MKIVKTKSCGSMFEMLKKGNEALCAHVMVSVNPNTIEASTEKHIPVITINENVASVEVGSVLHPMLTEHYIEWIAIETTDGVYRRFLKPNTEPKAMFALLPNEKIISVYEYCNIHGLWKKDL